VSIRAWQLDDLVLGPEDIHPHVFPPHDFVPFRERRPGRSRAHLSSVYIRIRESVLESTGGRCWYCGELAELTVDHRVARCRGGRFERPNLVPACETCNREKASHKELVFLDEPARRSDPRFYAARRRVGLERRP
jgi:5-methylcytosine-specific restriction endonuclease McrA